MNGTGETEPPAAAPATDPHLYFQEIEEGFLRLRGRAVLLSPADWRLAADWQERGIPTSLVLGTLEEVWRRRAERGGSTARISSLRYFAPAVEAAWEDVRELGVAAGKRPPEKLNVAAALARLAAGLPLALARREVLVGEIEGLADQGAEAAERELARLEAEFLRHAAGALIGAETSRMEAEVEAGLRAVQARLSADQIDESRARLRSRWLRAHLALPVLSLFAFAAPAPDEELPAAEPSSASHPPAD